MISPVKLDWNNSCMCANIWIVFVPTNDVLLLMLEMFTVMAEEGRVGAGAKSLHNITHYTQ